MVKDNLRRIRREKPTQRLLKDSIIPQRELHEDNGEILSNLFARDDIHEVTKKYEELSISNTTACLNQESSHPTDELSTTDNSIDSGVPLQINRSQSAKTSIPMPPSHQRRPFPRRNAITEMPQLESQCTKRKLEDSPQSSHTCKRCECSASEPRQDPSVGGSDLNGINAVGFWLREDEDVVIFAQRVFNERTEEFLFDRYEKMFLREERAEIWLKFYVDGLFS